MFNIGDYVSRNSYNNDIIFQIIKIENSICYLRGVMVRLYADSLESDLKLEDKVMKDNFEPRLSYELELDRNEYFYLPGKILHIDGDIDYLSKCLKFYKNNRLKAYGIYLKESEFCEKIQELLKKYNPDILVLTGHDAYLKKRNNGYKNTSYFSKAVKEARKFEKSPEKLLIVAGACQSNYEDLIKSGSNFASSPKRVNIHALDPAIIAACLAFSNKNKEIDLFNIINKTKYGSDGIGGIITKGTMFVGFPR